MIEVRLEHKPAFTATGRKVWISGQDNAQFANFWQQAHEGRLVEQLRALSCGRPGAVTGATTFGISCVEKDPDDRAFWFFIAAESNGAQVCGLEKYSVPECTWAVFSNRSDAPDALGQALVWAEMHAFTQWLPGSKYRHANAPELEVYPAHDGSLVEFWLPVVPRSNTVAPI